MRISFKDSNLSRTTTRSRFLMTSWNAAREEEQKLRLCKVSINQSIIYFRIISLHIIARSQLAN